MANQEIEVKLELDGDEGASHRLQAELEQRYGPGRAVALTSTYFDTADLALREAALSLRIRRVDGRSIQTIKSRSSRKGGMFSRDEWEREIEGEEPDFAAAAETPLAPLLRQEEVKNTLAPAFQSIIERTVWDVSEGDGQVELALDRGVIQADGRSAPVCELELELKSGEPPALVSLAKDLETIAPMRLGGRSKADRGYQLLEKTDREAVHAETPALTPSMTAGTAFQVIARSCVRHFTQNEPLVIQARSEDALHQVRVALRRLRSALSFFKPVIADTELDELKERLSQLGGALGPARDLDVFMKALIARDAADEATVTLIAQLRARRDEAYEAAVQAMSGPLARRLMLDLSVWIEAGPWTAVEGNEARELPVRKFAAAELERRRKRVKSGGRHLKRLSAEERHQVRIAAKKLRYATEFMSSLHTDKRSRRRHRAFLEASKELLGELGELNDIVQGQELAEQLAESFSDRRTSPGERRKLIFALGREAGRRAAECDARVAAAADAYDRFAAAKRFW